MYNITWYGLILAVLFYCDLFQGFKIFFFVTGGIYLLYLIYLLVRAYAELRSMPYFGKYNRFFPFFICDACYI